MNHQPSIWQYWMGSLCLITIPWKDYYPLKKLQSPFPCCHFELHKKPKTKWDVSIKGAKRKREGGSSRPWECEMLAHFAMTLMCLPAKQLS